MDRIEAMLHSSRVDMFQVPSIKCCHLVGLRKYLLEQQASRDMDGTHSPGALENSKIWLCSQAYD